MDSEIVIEVKKAKKVHIMHFNKRVQSSIVGYLGQYLIQEKLFAIARL